MTAKPIEFSIEAADLHRGLHNAALFTDSNYLPVLAATQIEGGKDGLVFAATDRYTLGATTAPYKGRPFTFLLRAADSKLLRTLFPAKSKVTLNVTVDGNEMTIQPTPGVIDVPNVTVTVTAEAGEFPKWRKLLDPANPASLEKAEKEPFQSGDVLGLNPRFLARFGRVSTAATGTDASLRVQIVSKTGLVRIEIGDEFVGAQMPVRLHTEAATVRAAS